MADFLASFNFHESIPEQIGARSCGSVEELRSRLHGIFSAKVSPSRAEHVATTLDLAGSARLMLEKENDSLEGLNNIDPLLGGLGALGSAVEQPQEGGGHGDIRVVLAADALANQPSDNPVLQRSVAKAIINVLSELDGSEWTVKGLSRGTSGWTFVYICRGSLQHWNRQNKSQAKALIADYSQRELDPQLSGRPAFDCRGSVTVAFSRETRTISIIYEHTPLHKTVAELAALLKSPTPPPQPPPTVVEKPTKAQKTPKRPRRPREEGDKEKRGKSAKKKRRKTTGNDADQMTIGIGPQEAGPSQISDVAAQQASAAGSEAAAAAAAAGEDAQATPYGTLSLNVSPEEAERRRNVASVMLRGSGVDPDSLSPEQFNIFANQSPDLQKESLNMLVRYGAERLRIVHPGNREGSASTQQNSQNLPAQASSVQASPSGPVTTGELALPENQSDTGTKAATEAEAPAVKKRRGKKSRAACVQCKQRRAKCPHQLPTCAECESAGLICDYPPLYSRSKKPVKVTSVEIVQDEDDDAPDETTEIQQAEGIPVAQVEEEAGEGEGEGGGEEEEEEEYAEIQDHAAQPQMPVADMLTTDMGTADWRNDDMENHYYQSTANMSVSEMNAPQQAEATSHGSTPALVLTQGRMHYPTTTTTTATTTTTIKTSDTQAAENASSGRTTSSPRGNAVERRQPLPSGERNGQSSVMQHAPAESDWHAMSSLVTQAAAASVMVSSLPAQSSGDDGYGVRQGVQWRAAALPQSPPDGHHHQQQQQHGQHRPQQQQPQQLGMATTQRTSTAPPLEEARSKPNQRRSRYDDTTIQDPVEHHMSAHAPLAQTNYMNYDRDPDARNTAPSTSTSTANGSNSQITYEPYSYRGAPSSSSYPTYTQTTAAAVPTTAVTAMDHSSSRLFSQFPQRDASAGGYYDARSSTFDGRIKERGYSSNSQVPQQRHARGQAQSGQQGNWYGFNQSGFGSSSHGNNFSWGGRRTPPIHPQR